MEISLRTGAAERPDFVLQRLWSHTERFPCNQSAFGVTKPVRNSPFCRYPWTFCWCGL